MIRKSLLAFAALVAAPAMFAAVAGAVVPRVTLVEEFGYDT